MFCFTKLKIIIYFPLWPQLITPIPILAKTKRKNTKIYLIYTCPLKYSKCFALTEQVLEDYMTHFPQSPELCPSFDWFIWLQWLVSTVLHYLIKYWSDDRHWMFILYIIFSVYSITLKGVDVCGYKQRLINVDSFHVFEFML